MAGSRIASLEDVERAMDSIFKVIESRGASTKRFADSDFDWISQLLAQLGKPGWAERPRTWTILKVVGSTSSLQLFIDTGLSDIAIPYTQSRLFSLLPRDLAFKFIENQSMVLTDAYDVEEARGRHQHLDRDGDAHFVVVRVLGSGGYAEVDHVQSKLSLQNYARKRIRRSKIATIDQESLKSFLREVTCLKRLKHHHLPTLLGSYTDPRYFTLIIKEVGDCNLKEYLEQSPFPNAEKWSLRGFYGSLISAIAYIHNNKVRHKDLKPSNILVMGSRVLLTDFGAALNWSDHESSTTWGRRGQYTPGYMAPEVEDWQPRNSSTDIYSLGLVFMDITTVLKGETFESRVEHYKKNGSHTPFHRTNPTASRLWIQLLRQKSPEDNEPLKWICEMTHERPQDRSTADTLLKDIFGFQGYYRYYPICCEGIEIDESKTRIAYEPLDVDFYEFRVLEILPDPDDSPIRCALRKTSLIEEGTSATYNALSYCWGNPYITASIFINDVPTAVTTNLRNALWQLRALGIYRIWADALCINQEDKTERSLQVRFMKRIYENAKGVIAWLGEGSRDTTAALEFLIQPLLPATRTLEFSTEERRILDQFFELPYWTRVWIIQEVAVGSSVMILCGSQRLDWKQLDILDNISLASTSTRWRHVSQVRSFRKAYQEKKRISLIEAMQKSHAAHSTDPRDKIYALLGLTYDGDDLVPFPNYRQTLGEVLRDFTRATIRSKTSLDYLFCGPLVKPAIEGLPTWGLDWVGLLSDPGDLFEAKILPASNFTLTGSPHANILRTRGEILCTIELVVETPTSETDSSYSPIADISGSYYQDSIRIRDAICASLCLGNVSELSSASSQSRATFFSSLWDGNGRLSPQRHVETLQTLREPFVSVRCLGLEASTSNHTSQYPSRKELEKQRTQEIALITWLEDIGSLHIGGQMIQEWLCSMPERAGQLTDSLREASIPSRTLEHTSIIRCLLTIIQNQMKLVITKEGIIGMACATVCKGDKVCLLEGISANSTIILREVDIGGGRDTYQVVGRIFLAERESDPKYPSLRPDQVFDIV